MTGDRAPQGADPVCHAHHPISSSHNPGGIPTPAGHRAEQGGPGVMGSSGWSHLGVQGHMGGEPSVGHCLPLSAAQHQGLQTGVAVEPPPSGQALPQGPVGRGAEQRSLSSSPPRSGEKRWVPQAVARTPGAGCQRARLHTRGSRVTLGFLRRGGAGEQAGPPGTGLS